MTKLKEELAAPLRVMQEIARRIAKVSKESKLPINEDDYVKSFKVELMDAVVAAVGQKKAAIRLSPWNEYQGLS